MASCTEESHSRLNFTVTVIDALRGEIILYTMVTFKFHQTLTRSVLRMCVSLLLVIMSGGAARAQTDAPVYLVVALTDGNHYEYELSEKPVVAFLDDTFKLTSGQIEQEFVATEVADFHFASERTGIDRAEGSNAVTFRFTDNDRIVLGGLQTGTVRLYSTSGQLLRTAGVATEGVATLSLDGLTTGVYVLSAEGMPAMKISRK